MTRKARSPKEQFPRFHTHAPSTHGRVASAPVHHKILTLLLLYIWAFCSKSCEGTVTFETRVSQTRASSGAEPNQLLYYYHYDTVSAALCTVQIQRTRCTAPTIESTRYRALYCYDRCAFYMDPYELTR